jgi:hypothetical protein
MYRRRRCGPRRILRRQALLPWGSLVLRGGALGRGWRLIGLRPGHRQNDANKPERYKNEKYGKYQSRHGKKNSRNATARIAEEVSGLRMLPIGSVGTMPALPTARIIYARPQIISDAFSAIMMVGALVFPAGMVGITEASTTHRRSMP